MTNPAKKSTAATKKAQEKVKERFQPRIVNLATVGFGNFKIRVKKQLKEIRAKFKGETETEGAHRATKTVVAEAEAHVVTQVIATRSVAQIPTIVERKEKKQHSKAAPVILDQKEKQKVKTAATILEHKAIVEHKEKQKVKTVQTAPIISEEKERQELKVSGSAAISHSVWAPTGHITRFTFQIDGKPIPFKLEDVYKNIKLEDLFNRYNISVLLDGNSYTFQQRLGEGVYGETGLFQDEAGNKLVIKMQKPRKTNPYPGADIYNEALCRLDQDDRVGFFGDEKSNTEMHALAMVYKEGTTLRKMAEDGNILSEEHFVKIISAIIEATDRYHQNGWTHGDLNPGNIIIREPKGTSKVEADLIDSGMSHRVGEKIELSTWKDDTFYAPELMIPQIDPLKASPKQDIYSLGFILYHIYSHCEFENYDLLELLNKMKSKAPGDRPDLDEIQERLSDILKDLKKATEHAPASKQTAGQAIALKNFFDLSSSRTEEESKRDTDLKKPAGEIPVVRQRNFFSVTDSASATHSSRTKQERKSEGDKNDKEAVQEDVANHKIAPSHDGERSATELDRSATQLEQSATESDQQTPLADYIDPEDLESPLTEIEQQNRQVQAAVVFYTHEYFGDDVVELEEVPASSSPTTSSSPDRALTPISEITHAIDGLKKVFQNFGRGTIFGNGAPHQKAKDHDHSVSASAHSDHSDDSFDPDKYAPPQTGTGIR